MKSLGYITLTEAEQLSGVKADTLKKRCQEGKISGAVKQGNIWFIPRAEIVKEGEAVSKDAVLALLVSLSAAGVEVGVTLFVKGVIFSGQIISADKYFQRVRVSIEKSIEQGKSPEAIRTIFSKMFESAQNIDPKDYKKIFDTPVNYIHLDEVKFRGASEMENMQDCVLRLKISEVDGFVWGRMENLPSV